MDLHLLHEKIEDLRNRTKPWSHKTEEIISRLKDEGIEILSSQLDRQTVIVWIWCHSKAALEYVQRLYESNQLTYILFELTINRPCTSGMTPSKVIRIESDKFRKTAGKFRTHWSL